MINSMNNKFPLQEALKTITIGTDTLNQGNSLPTFLFPPTSTVLIGKEDLLSLGGTEQKDAVHDSDSDVQVTTSKIFSVCE